DLALGDVDGVGAARVSAVAKLQGVTSRFDLHLDCVVHFDRRDVLAVDHDVERSTADLHADCPSRQLDRCRHFDSPLGRVYGLLALLHPTVSSFCSWWSARDRDTADGWALRCGAGDESFAVE